jgi:hypothetical protein
VGGAYGDRMDGGSGRDLVFGDNVTLDRTTGDGMANARYRTLSGSQIYSTASGSAGTVLVTADSRNIPGGAPVWEDFNITLLDHDQATETAALSNFGNDYIAGGAGNDQVFGQLGNDTLQGDGSIDLAADVSASRGAGGLLSVQPSVENLATDGDDYIEGNGGNDIVFGNLGQDDIIGGSSSLFSLTTADRRTDATGADLLFGGAGTDVALTDAGRLDMGDTSASGHANDSDMILGDNGNVYRLVSVGAGGATQFLQFNYDKSSTYEDRGAVRIVVRAADLLDYTPGGSDVSAAAANDIGAADEIHGESSDDFIYGMKGHDVLFGEGQDDDIIGGYGNEWISGGTGQDGVIGDDGRIFTSRNGTADPLGGVAVKTTQTTISTPGKVQLATLNPTGELKKSVDLTPFSQDTAFDGTDDEFDNVSKHTSDDIIYGGLGSDWLHGGTGDDAMSGAEALWTFYRAPQNAGDSLQYDPTTTEFALYDEYAPMTKISGFLLNFNAAEGPVAGVTVHSDGDDRIFGDNGNDWLVGGTGRDNLYGGWGDDLMNADDDQDTNTGLNDAPDTNTSYEDRAYGGAGRDVLIGNTGGDRLIDWVGEFNSFIVPFAPYGLGTVSRTLQPQLAEFLYGLSASDGVDLTRATDAGGDPARNGEPQGELGVVRQQDFAWQDETGGPRDVQAGNIAGGKRDVLRSAGFNDPNVPLSGFAADSGIWTVSGGALQVSAKSPIGDAAAVFQIGDALPNYFEMTATVRAIKPTSGWNANAYVIFDYNSATDFKFAGIDVSTNKIVIGHRDAKAWVVDSQKPLQVKSNVDYNIMLVVNGLTATMIVDGKTTLSKTYQPRVVDGYSYGLNWGLVGVGSNRARGQFDNISVQVIAPEATVVKTDTFTQGTGELFDGQPGTGTWTADGGRLTGTPAAGSDAAAQLMTLGVDSIQPLSLLGFEATLQTTGQGGFVFDRYSDHDYKFVAIDVAAGQVIIGHSTTRGGVVVDASASRALEAGVDYRLEATLVGSTVSVTLDGQAVVSHAFNAVTVDGRFGLLSRNGVTGFDSATAKTNDPRLTPVQTLLAAEPAPEWARGHLVTSLDVQPLLDEAARRFVQQGLHVERGDEMSPGPLGRRLGGQQGLHRRQPRVVGLRRGAVEAGHAIARQQAEAPIDRHRVERVRDDGLPVQGHADRRADERRFEAIVHARLERPAGRRIDHHPAPGRAVADDDLAGRDVDRDELVVVVAVAVEHEAALPRRLQGRLEAKQRQRLDAVNAERHQLRGRIAAGSGRAREPPAVGRPGAGAGLAVEQLARSLGERVGLDDRRLGGDHLHGDVVELPAGPVRTDADQAPVQPVRVTVDHARLVGLRQRRLSIDDHRGREAVHHQHDVVVDVGLHLQGFLRVDHPGLGVAVPDDDLVGRHVDAGELEVRGGVVVEDDVRVRVPARRRLDGPDRGRHLEVVGQGVADLEHGRRVADRRLGGHLQRAA